MGNSAVVLATPVDSLLTSDSHVIFLMLAPAISFYNQIVVCSIIDLLTRYLPLLTDVQMDNLFEN